MPRASKSTGTARTTTNGKRGGHRRGADEDYEQVFGLAVELEEQGERYQFGAKAKRNYEQAIQNYRLSVALLARSPPGRSPSDGFNSHFNLARVLVGFGATFASSPSECLQFAQLGTIEYRQAVDYAIRHSSHLDEIDARYNLGLGFSTIAEMLSTGAALDDGPSGGLDGHSTAIQLWKQAKEELSRAYQLQERILVSSPDLGSPYLAEGTPEDEMIDDLAQQQPKPASPANGQTALVEEVFVVTPCVLIDTLLDICEVLLSIYPSEPKSASAELGHYVQQLQAINQRIESSADSHFSRRFEIDSLICNIELTTIEHALSESLMNADSCPSVMIEMGRKLSAVSQKLEELSQDSCALDNDFLKLLGLANNFSSVSTATCSLITIRSKIAKTAIPDSEIDALKPLIEKTISLYSVILGKLKHSKLRPIKQIKPHEVSSYISSSLVGQSELALILECLDQQRESRPCSQTHSFDLAIDAYNQSAGPYRISRDSTPHSLKLAFTPAQQLRSTNAKEERNEWPYFSARLEAIKALLRSKFHHLRFRSSNEHHPLDLEQLLKNELSPLITKFGLSRNDLTRFYEDFLDDPVFILSDSIEKPLFDLFLRSHHYNN